jgi:hypothetical protein
VALTAAQLSMLLEGIDWRRPTRSCTPRRDRIATLGEILRDLQSYDEEPFAWQEPTIYAAEPWTTRYSPA